MAVLAVALLGCQSPLERTTEQQLRDELIQSYRSQVAAVAAGPVIELQRDNSDVIANLSPERRAELEQMSGIGAYQDTPLDVGANLLGSKDNQVVQISLQQAIDLTVRYNLDLQVARINPAIDQAVITQALAAFDATFFATGDIGNINVSNSFAFPGFPTSFEQDLWGLATGIRKNLVSGGNVEFRVSGSRNDSNISTFASSSAYSADVLFTLQQPLLRGFGADVNRAEIVLAQNARRSDMEQLRNNLITISAQTEAAYWNLLFTKQQLLIQTRLLARTIEDRDRLQQRADFDVNPVRLTEANSFVELRRADVIRARQAVRDASDQLKQLINAPELPVADETILIPTDVPVDQPIEFSLLDAVTTALQHRPELQIALLSIKDTSVRLRVADNARLPLLNLSASVGVSGIDSGGVGNAFSQLGSDSLLNYLLTADFEVPIGNRAAEALFTQRQLERRQAVADYQRQAQLVVLDVKTALRELLTAYELIGATRAARLAAADNLRAIEEQEAAGVALTPEFLLDLKLNTQQRLADAETQEIQALTDYNNSISTLFQATGTLLQRNGIEFADYEVEGRR